MILKRFVITMSLLALAGCGFKPIYATPENGAAALNQLIAVRQVSAPETVAPLIDDALERRIVLREGQNPQYDLYIEATERAERLAVQIDATVTRFNYRLTANYTLVDLKTGERLKGDANAVASYNIVTSQYSTLFAEKTAQEKAARLLAEEIERDILIQLSTERAAPSSVADQNFPVQVDPSTNLIVEDVDPGDTIKTRPE